MPEVEYVASHGAAVDDDDSDEQIGAGDPLQATLAQDRAWLARNNAIRQLAEQAQFARQAAMEAGEGPPAGQGLSGAGYL